MVMRAGTGVGSGLATGRGLGVLIIWGIGMLPVMPSGRPDEVAPKAGRSVVKSWLEAVALALLVEGGTKVKALLKEAGAANLSILVATTRMACSKRGAGMYPELLVARWGAGSQ